jgi:hypothetical protein
MRRVRMALVLFAAAFGMLAFTAPAQAAAAPFGPTLTMHNPDGTITVKPLSGIRPDVTNPCNGLGLVCLFQNSNGGGSIDSFSAGFLNAVGVWNLTNDPCGSCTNGIHGNDGTWNDQMSSWGNDTGTTFCWWVNINRGGAGHVMHSLGPTIQNLLANENDTASSVGTTNSSCH